MNKNQSNEIKIDEFKLNTHNNGTCQTKWTDQNAQYYYS